MSTQYDLFGNADQRATTEVKPIKQGGRWCYKLAIYSPDRVAETLALIRYRALPILTETPLIKNAFDAVTQRSATFIYWTQHPQPFITLLEDEGRKGHNLDAYLLHYDWDSRRTTKLQECHYHRAPRRDGTGWEEVRDELGR